MKRILLIILISLTTIVNAQEGIYYYTNDTVGDKLNGMVSNGYFYSTSTLYHTNKCLYTINDTGEYLSIKILKYGEISPEFKCDYSSIFIFIMDSIGKYEKIIEIKNVFFMNDKLFFQDNNYNKIINILSTPGNYEIYFNDPSYVYDYYYISTYRFRLYDY